MIERVPQSNVEKHVYNRNTGATCLKLVPVTGDGYNRVLQISNLRGIRVEFSDDICHFWMTCMSNRRPIVQVRSGIRPLPFGYTVVWRLWN
jgi:hypothetical protein